MVCHVKDLLLRSEGNLLEDLLTSMLADVVTNHDAMCLVVVSL